MDIYHRIDTIYEDFTANNPDLEVFLTTATPPLCPQNGVVVYMPSLADSLLQKHRTSFNLEKSGVYCMPLPQLLLDLAHGNPLAYSILAAPHTHNLKYGWLYELLTALSGKMSIDLRKRIQYQLLENTTYYADDQLDRCRRFCDVVDYMASGDTYAQALSRGTLNSSLTREQIFAKRREYYSLPDFKTAPTYEIDKYKDILFNILAGLLK